MFFFTRLSKHLNFVFIALFIIFNSLLLLLLGFENISGIKIKKIDLYENREMAKFPKISEVATVEIPKKIACYFNDNLPFRTQIINCYRSIWESNTLDSSTYELIEGKNGHYFNNSELNNSTRKDNINFIIINRIKTFLKGFEAFAKLQDKKVLLYLIPDKPRVYSEDLPAWVKKDNSTIEKINNNLKSLNSSSLKIINLTPILHKNKTKYPLYNKIYDITHWNGNALDIMYNILNKELSQYKFYSLLKNKPYEIIQKPNVVRVAGEKKSETVPWMFLNKEGLKLLDNKYLKEFSNFIYNNEIEVVENNEIKNGRILMLADSYIRTTHQENFTSSRYNKVFPLAKNVHILGVAHYFTCNNYMFIKQLNSDLKPDIYIFEFIERQTAQFTHETIDNREWFIAGEIINNEPYLFITPDAIGLKTINSSNTNHIIDLPAIMPNKNGRICVMAKIKSSKKGKVTLYYTQSNNKYKKPKAFSQDIRKGDNFLYIPLYGQIAKEFKLSLEFDSSGNYTIYQKPKLDEIFMLNQ